MAKIEYQATALPGSGNDLYRAAFNAYATAGKNLSDAFNGLVKQGQDWRDTQLNQYIASQYDANNLNSINEAIKNAATNPAFANASAKAWENINKERANWNTGLNTDNLAQDEVRVASANNAMQAAVNTAMTPNDVRYANDLIKGAVATNANSRALQIPEAYKVNELLLNDKAKRANLYASAKRMADEDSVYDCMDFIARNTKADLSNAQEVVNKAMSMGMWNPKTVWKATERLNYPMGPFNRVDPNNPVSINTGKTPMTFNKDGSYTGPQDLSTSFDLSTGSNTEKKQTGKLNNNKSTALTPQLNVSDLIPNSSNGTAFSLGDNSLPGSNKVNQALALHADNNITAESVAAETQKQLDESQQAQVIQDSINRSLQNPLQMKVEDANNFVQYLNSKEGQTRYNDDLLFRTQANAAMERAKRLMPAVEETAQSNSLDAIIQQSSPKAQTLINKTFPSVPKSDYDRAKAELPVGSAELSPEEYQRTRKALYGDKETVRKEFLKAYNAEDGQVKQAVEVIANSTSIPKNQKPQLAAQVFNTYIKETSQKLKQENDQMQYEELAKQYPYAAQVASPKMFKEGNLIPTTDSQIKNTLTLEAVNEELKRNPANALAIAEYIGNLAATNDAYYGQFFHSLTTMYNGADSNFMAQDKAKSSNTISDFGLITLALSGNANNNTKAFTEGYPLTKEAEKKVDDTTTLYNALSKVLLSEGIKKEKVDDAVEKALKASQYIDLPPFVVAQAASKFVAVTPDTVWGDSLKFEDKAFGKYIKNLEVVSNAIKTGNYDGLNSSQQQYVYDYENIRKLRQNQEITASYFGGANEAIKGYNKKLQELATLIKNSKGYSLPPDQYQKIQEDLDEIVGQAKTNMGKGLQLFKTLK